MARIRSRQGKAKVAIVTPSASPPVAAAPMPRGAPNQSAFGEAPELAIVTGPPGPVSAIAFSPDGLTLATGDGEGAIKLWSVQNGAGLRAITEANTLGALLKAGAEATSSALDTPAVSSLAFSFDGKILAGALVRTPNADAEPEGKLHTEIAFWDVASGRLLRTLSGITIDVQAIAFSPDGKWLASGGNSNVVTLWDVHTGTEFKSFSGHAPFVNSVMFTSGNEVQSGNWDALVDVWDVASAMPLREIQGNPLLGRNGGSTQVFSIKTIFNSATRRFASINFGSTGTFFTEQKEPSEPSIILRDGTSKTLREFKLDNETPTVIAFNASGNILAGGSNNGNIRLWDADSGSELTTIKKGFSSDIIAMSPDNTTIAQINEGGQSIKLWDTGNETTMKGLSGHTDDINSLAFSPDSNSLASGSDDKTIRLWDLKSGEVKVLTGHTDSVGPIAFHPSGKVLASIADNSDSEGEGDVKDNTIRFWDVETGRELTKTPDASIPLSLAFSPDGSTLAVGNHDATISLLDLSGKTAPRTLAGTGGEVASILFINRETLQSISLSLDETTVVINLWQVLTGQLLKTSRGSQSDMANKGNMFVGNLPFIAMSKDFYAMPVKGNGLTLFRRTSLEINPGSQPELATLYLLDDNEWLITTPDGLFDGSPGAWPRAIWRFNNSTFGHAPVESFFNEFFYPGLLSDILAGKHPKARSDISSKDRRQPQLRVGLAEVPGGADITTRSLRVKVDILQAAAGAQDVRLFRNGTLVKVWHGDVLKGQSSVSLEAVMQNSNLNTNAQIANTCI